MELYPLSDADKVKMLRKLALFWDGQWFLRSAEMFGLEEAIALNAAHAVGLGHEVGSLEIGKKADLLVLDIPDYRHLSYRFGTNLVQTVIKAGRVAS